VVLILEHEVLYDRKHHGKVVAAVAYGQDGYHIQLITSWVGPREKVEGWRTSACPVNEIVTVLVDAVVAREGDIEKCQTSRRSDNERLFFR
jgi:hypothetical protein